MNALRHGWRQPSYRLSAILYSLCLLGLVLLLPAGCVRNTNTLTGAPVVRVRLLEHVNSVTLAASEPAVFRAGSDKTPYRLRLPSSGVPVILSPGGWRVGDKTLGTGILTVRPEAVGSVKVNQLAYRGTFRLVPTGPGLFDVVNDVDLEGYLKGVVAKELLRQWHEEAYRAQAIVARTYALYEMKTAPADRHYDVNDDQSSQVYGGLSAESAKSRQAVDGTAGVVVAYGLPGQERIFHAYFSSCCGGITQNVADVFPNDSYIEPLAEQNPGPLCSASPRFNWGPVVVKKDELTRRFRAWGLARKRPEKDIGAITAIEIEVVNHYGRPKRFRVFDARGFRYSMSGEEIRTAINYDAPGTTVYSSFFKIINDPDAIHFVDGHGWGHGVGMCQWCAERRAEEGMCHEDIVLAAYPRSQLIRAY